MKPSAFRTRALGDRGTADYSDQYEHDSLVRRCAAGRKAPVLPSALERDLEDKGFTNGKDDRPRVAKLYKSSFAQRFESVEVLRYQSLGWGNEQAKQASRGLRIAVLALLARSGRRLPGPEGAATEPAPGRPRRGAPGPILVEGALGGRAPGRGSSSDPSPPRPRPRKRWGRDGPRSAEELPRMSGSGRERTRAREEDL